MSIATSALWSGVRAAPMERWEKKLVKHSMESPSEVRPLALRKLHLQRSSPYLLLRWHRDMGDELLLLVFASFLLAAFLIRL